MLRSSRYVEIPWLVSFRISLNQQRCQFSTFLLWGRGFCQLSYSRRGLPPLRTQGRLTQICHWGATQSQILTHRRPTALQTCLQVIDANGTSELDGSPVQRIQATGVQSAGLFRMVSPVVCWGASEGKSETSWSTNSHEWSDEVSPSGSCEPWGNSVPFSKQSVGCCWRNSGTLATRASLAMKFTSDTLFKLSCRLQVNF